MGAGVSCRCCKAVAALVTGCRCAVPCLRALYRTLAELDLPHACREVVDKDADAVLGEVETAILMVRGIGRQISAGRPPFAWW